MIPRPDSSFLFVSVDDQVRPMSKKRRRAYLAPLALRIQPPERREPP